MLACLLLVAATALGARPAAAQPVAAVAMVSDLQGAVRMVKGRASTAAILLAEIPADSRLEIDAGARVVLLILSSGEEATVRGPATVAIDARGVSATPPSAITRKSSSVGDTKLRRKDVTQAAIVMRKTGQTVRLPLLALASTITAESRPVFRWAAVEGSGPYRYTLFDSGGRQLYAATTEATELVLPEGVALVAGPVYSWEVTTRRANGIEYSNFGDFAIAAPALREAAARLRPSEAAAFSDWVAYAVWLDTQELSDAARAVWARLAAQRPGEAELARMAE